MWHEIESARQLEELIGEKPGVFAYFGTPDCGVCHALRPKVGELLDRDFPLLEAVYVDCMRVPDAAARWAVFAVPVVIAWFDGREFVRKARSFGLGELADALRRPYRLLFSGG